MRRDGETQGRMVTNEVEAIKSTESIPYWQIGERKC